MSEIKFNAWDKEEKIMWYDVHAVYDSEVKHTPKDCNGDGKICTECYAIGCNSFRDFVKTKDRFVVLGYTGHKDSNDKEIYEGDVLKVTCNDNDIESIHVVKNWTNSGYPTYDLYPSYDDTCNSLQVVASVQPNGEEVKVIGNIYENPEKIKRRAGKGRSQTFNRTE